MQMEDWMRGQNSGISTSLVTIHRARIVRHIAEASAGHQRGAVPEILRSCQSADFNPRSTSASTGRCYIRSAVINPYSLSILSHGCLITLFIICCVRVARSGFSTISCSDITRFRIQLRDVRNYAFLKEDPRASMSANFREPHTCEI